jgi:hypothetical protein
MYNTDKIPTAKDIVIRLVEIGELKDRWKDITKNYYGKEVAGLLKEVAPADPYILYDLSATSLMGGGMSEKEAIKTVDAYTHKEWLREYEGFKHLLSKTVDKMYKEVSKTNGV